MLAFLTQPTKDAAKTFAQGGLSIVESSILGAITIVAIGIAVLAVWKMLKVQDGRVADLVRSTKERDQLLSSIVKLNNDMIETFTDLRSSVEQLRESEKQGQEVLRGVRQALDTVVLSAVQGKGD